MTRLADHFDPAKHLGCRCGTPVPDGTQLPFVCGCGHRIESMDDRVAMVGVVKADVCRANICGNYDAERDACKVLTAKDKPGKVSWLYRNSDARCVADEPLF